ncbi:MAG: hypothetical protein ACK5H2_12220 [Beutenbergiaceae bacterium]
MSTASAGEVTMSLDASTAWRHFDKKTSRWGQITMITALILMVGGPTIIAMQLGVELSGVWIAVVAVAAVFGIIWVVEPFAYFPILGAASMYQAFMIGNISSKLVPSALVAQAAIDAKPDTRRGQLASVLAICGAAAVHLTSLLLFVAIFGTFVIQLIPENVITAVQTYILSAVMGAVLVQVVVSNPKPRMLGIAIGVGLLVQLVLVPLAPVVAFFAVALAVALTITLALTLPGKAMDAPTPKPTTIGTVNDNR